MKITFDSISFRVEGVRMSPPFTFFDIHLSHIFESSALNTSFEEIAFVFAYPTPIPLRNENKAKEEYMNWYSKLPMWRTSNKRKKAVMTIKFPEYLKYLSGRYDETETLDLVINKLIESFHIIETKLKPEDTLDCTEVVEYLEEVKQTTHKEQLWEIEESYEEQRRKDLLKRNKAERDNRTNIEGKKPLIIRDIRLFYHFDNIGIKFFSPYDITICNKIIDLLKPYKFKCPGYTHIYISAAESFDKALYHSTRYESWYAYGIALLKDPAEYAEKTELEKKQIVFDLIKAGILDIAVPNNMDLDILNKVLDEVEESYVRKLPDPNRLKNRFS